MSENFENETDDLIENASADLLNAVAKEEAGELRNDAQKSFESEKNSLDSNTASLIKNSAAQEQYNEHIREALTQIEQLKKTYDSLKNNDGNINAIAEFSNTLDQQLKDFSTKYNQELDTIQSLLDQGAKLEYRAGDRQTPTGQKQDPAYGHGVRSGRTGEWLDSGGYWSQDFEQVQYFKHSGRDIAKGYALPRNELVVNDSQGYEWDNLNYFGREGTKLREYTLNWIKEFEELEKQVYDSTKTLEERRKITKDLIEMSKIFNEINNDPDDFRSFSDRYNFQGVVRDFTPKITDEISALAYKRGYETVDFVGVTDGVGPTGQQSTKNETLRENYQNITYITELGKSIVNLVETIQREESRISQGLSNDFTGLQGLYEKLFTGMDKTPTDTTPLSEDAEEFLNSNGESLKKVFDQLVTNFETYTESFKNAIDQIEKGVDNETYTNILKQFNLSSATPVTKFKQIAEQQISLMDPEVLFKTYTEHFINKVQSFIDSHSTGSPQTTSIQGIVDDFKTHNGDLYDGQLLTEDRLRNVAENFIEAITHREDILGISSSDDDDDLLNDEYNLDLEDEEEEFEIATEKVTTSLNNLATNIEEQSKKISSVSPDSYLVSPDLKSIQSVNDLILTKDGRAYVTDDADNIIATKDPWNLGKVSGEHRVVEETSGKVLGLLSDKDAQIFTSLIAAIKNVDNIKSTIDRLDANMEKLRNSSDPLASTALKEYEAQKNELKQIIEDTKLLADKKSNMLNEASRRAGVFSDVINWKDKEEFSILDRIDRQEFSKRQNDVRFDRYESAVNRIQKDSAKDDALMIEFRTTYREFIKNLSDINRIAKNEFSTIAERQKAFEFNNREDTKKIGNFTVYGKDEEGDTVIVQEASGLLGTFEELNNQLKKYQEMLNDSTISENEKIELSQKVTLNQEEYQKTLEKLNSIMSELNPEMSKFKESTSEATNAQKQSAEERKKLYDQARYAPIRTKEQAEMFKRFEATGSYKTSFEQTLFNKATGYRQRTGLTGLLANIGYRQSGTLKAVGLGAFGKAITDATKAVIKFSQESLEAFGRIETVKTNLGIVYGSQSQADALFNDIAQYSVKSPFGVETVSSFAVQLKQSGVYASNLMDTLKQIGDVAGGNQQKFGNIANAFAQIEANGKATTRQLREFATAGIPIYAELSKELGKGVEQIRKMTEEGKITSNIIEKVFQNMTGPGGMFNNAVNIGSKTWAARQQNLQDAKQLAQAEFGQMLLNIGDHGENDSIGRNLLEIKEGLFNGLQDWAHLRNIDHNVEMIEIRENRLKALQEEYDRKKKDGASETELKRIQERINQLNALTTISEKRALQAEVYRNSRKTLDSYTIGSESAGLQRFNQIVTLGGATRGWHKFGNNALKYYASLPDEVQDFNPLNFIVNKLAKTNPYAILNGVDLASKEGRKNAREFYQKRIDYFENGRTAIEKKEAEKGLEFQFQQIYLNIEDIAAKAWDRVQTNAFKKDSSLYKLGQKSEQEWLKTDAGKKYTEDQEKELWNKGYEAYQRLAPLIDDSGTLLSGLNLSLETFGEILDSGIINPLEQVQMVPENFVNDIPELFYGKTEEEQERIKEANQKNWEDLGAKVMSLSSIQADAFTNAVITALQSYLFNADGSMKGNTEANYRTFAEGYEKILGRLAERNSSLATQLPEYLVSRYGKAGNIRSWDETHQTKGKDTYPLWQRILNSTLGVDLEHFKSGQITRGDQAVELFAKQAQKNSVKNITRAMLNNMSVADVFSVNGGTRIAYTGKKTSTGNNSRDNTSSIDWEGTAKNFQSFAMSLTSATEVTQAYASSLQEETDSLREFLASSFTTMEDGANIYDPEYQKHLGEFANSIKATDANAYDVLFTNENGFIKMRENATTAAKALLDQKTQLTQTVSALSEFKSKIDELSKSTDALSVELSVMAGGAQKGAFKGWDTATVKDFTNKLTDTLNKDEYKELAKNEKFQVRNILKLFTDDESFKNLVTSAEMTKSQQESVELKKGSATSEQQERYNNAKAAYQAAQVATEVEYRKWFNQISEYQRSAFGGDFDTMHSNKELDAKAWSAFVSYAVGNDYIQKLFANQNATNRAFNEASKVLSDAEAQAIIDNSSELINAEDNLMLAIYQNYVATDENTKALKQLEFVNKFNENSITNQVLNGQYEHSFLLGTDFAINSTRTGSNSFVEQNLMNQLGLGEMNYQDTILNLINNKDASDFFTSLGFSQENLRSQFEQYEALKNQLSKGEITQEDFDEQNTWDETSFNLFKKIDSAVFKKSVSGMLDDAMGSITDSLSSGLFSGVADTFKTMGKYIDDMSAGSEEIAKCWKQIGANIFGTIGSTMIQTGLTIAGQAALKGEWGMVFAGLTMAGVGGIASLISGMFEDDEQDDKESRLKNLKDMLADLLEQAKTDAEYYEKNLRHENAIDRGYDLSYQSVNDAIIAPGGKVITTAPDDYLIATKTPGSLAGGRGNVNITIVNEAGDRVKVGKTEQREGPNGELDIRATIVAVVNEAVANGEVDGAFAAREANNSGRRYTM
ncbi:MAG: tape measure protein [Bacilli bacterium]|nr:tape measure protein [Bacilli bacterium]